MELVNLLDERFIRFYSKGNPKDALCDTLRRPGEFAYARLVPSDRFRKMHLVAARTLGVPARIAVQSLGENHTRFFIAHTIEEIRAAWMEGVGEQWTKTFSPDYTQMLPAFYQVTIDTLNVRDRQYEWFLPGPEHELYEAGRKPLHMMSPHPMIVGEQYMRTLYEIVTDQLSLIPGDVPIGVSLSGGADSTAVLTALCYALNTMHLLNDLYVYTLAVDGGGSDAQQATDVVMRLKAAFPDTTLHHHLVHARSEDINKDALIEEASRVAEEYHMHDVGCAMAGLVLYRGLSRMDKEGVFPPISCDFNGDGGNEIFRDYPLVDPAYAVIPFEHVLDDPQLLLLGYPLRRLAYNPIFSSGLSRGYTRTFNPARLHGVVPFSPLIDRRMIDLGQRIPLRDLAEKPSDIYGVRPQVVREGIKATLGIDMPAFPKSRFQEGCSADPKFLRITTEDVTRLRRKVLHP